MKQFSVKEYLANPSLKVVTREGKLVRIVCTDAMSEYPIVALVRQNENTESMCNFTQDGTCIKGVESSCDLFFAPKKREGWANIYRSNKDGCCTQEHRFSSNIYDTKDEAENVAKCDTRYVTTTKIEWEE